MHSIHLYTSNIGTHVRYRDRARIYGSHNCCACAKHLTRPFIRKSVSSGRSSAKMALPRYFLLFLLMKESLACSGRYYNNYIPTKSRVVYSLLYHNYSGQNVNQIVDILLEVVDWKYLANQLDINSDIIEADCLKSSPAGSCYRRELVKTYCDSSGLGVEDVAENIAHSLGPSNRRQANHLREKFSRTCPGNSVVYSVSALCAHVLYIYRKLCSVGWTRIMYHHTTKQCIHSSTIFQ